MIRGLIWLKACPDFHAPAGCHCAGAGRVSWDWVMLRWKLSPPNPSPQTLVLRMPGKSNRLRNTEKHHKASQGLFWTVLPGQSEETLSGNFSPQQTQPMKFIGHAIRVFYNIYQCKSSIPISSLFYSCQTYDKLRSRFGFPICKSLHGIGISAQAWQPHRAFLKTPRKASGEVTSFIASW